MSGTSPIDRRRVLSSLSSLTSRSAGRQTLRDLVQSVGLLGLARETRDFASGLGRVRENAQFWLHGSPDGLPIPPLRIVRASTGTSSLPWLFHGGALAATSIRDALAKNKTDIGDFRSILDFGCGCGRVIRHWATLKASIHGCDYNRASIRWCRRNLTFAAFEANALTPPLPYASEQFDLVYALSVFTHLPEPLMFAWRRKARKIGRAHV